MQVVKVVEKFDKKILEAILDLEKKCFPPEWQHEDSYEYFRDALNDLRCINIVLLESDKIVGYLLAIEPNDDLLDFINEYDKMAKYDPTRVYLDNIEVLPEARGQGGSKKMMQLMCEAANKRGFFSFAVHARIKNGLNEAIKKMFKDSIEKVRKIDKWKFGGNEPYEYIEWSYKKSR